MTELKDSGERRRISTGAVRDRGVGKGRMDLLPWFALEELSLHFEAGAAKYSPNNWLRGMPLSWFLDSALRHLGKAARGQTDEPHWRAAAWNVMCLIDIKKRIELGMLPSELNDLQPEMSKEVQEKLDALDKLRSQPSKPQDKSPEIPPQTILIAGYTNSGRKTFQTILKDLAPNLKCVIVENVCDLQKHPSAKLIFVDRYDICSISGRNSYFLPRTSIERDAAPLLRINSDYHIKWEDAKGDISKLAPHVKKFLQWLKIQ